MRYEVRYIVENEEHTRIVDVENAALAVESVEEQQRNADSFELIQVQLLDELDVTNETAAPEEA